MKKEWNELKNDLDEMRALFIELGGGMYHEGYVACIDEVNEIMCSIEKSTEPTAEDLRVDFPEVVEIERAD